MAVRDLVLRRRARRDEGGAVAVVVAILSVVLLVCAALAVDLGRAWAARGAAQDQADKAAIAAASGLPVQLTGAQKASTQLQAARYAAHYLACNPVSGQPAFAVPCSASLTPFSTSLDATATRMLTNGLARAANSATYDPGLPAVSFPSQNQVEVAGARATTDFMFGQVAGGEDLTTVKYARAKVSSPGQMLPIALATDSTSVTSGMAGCLSNQRDSAHSAVPAVGDRFMSALSGPGTLLPVVGVGKRSGDPMPFAYPAGYPRAGESIRSTAQLKGLAIAPSTDHQTSVVTTQGSGITLNARGRDWNPRAIFSRRQLVFFNLATGQVAWSSTVTALGDDPDLDTYLLGQNVPATVLSTPGVWYVSVYMDQETLGDQHWWLPPEQVRTLQVIDPVEAFSRYDLHSCAKYLASPRRDTATTVTSGQTGAGSTMVRNLLSGLDHTVGVNPGANQTTCAGRQNVDGTVYDDAASLAAQTTPNCVRVAAGVTTSLEVTKGWLGTPPGDASGAVTGRLDCSYVLTRGHANCRSGRTFSLWGRTYNNDRLEDFIASPDALTTPYAFANDFYTGDGVALITPEAGRLAPGIYHSPRLFWAPVVSTPAGLWPEKPNGTQVRVLGYRPVFLTQSAPGDGSGDIRSNWCLNNSTPGVANPGMNPVTGEFRDPAGAWTGVHLNGVGRGMETENGACLVWNPTFKQFRTPTRLQGLQFQTIAPRTMPEVPVDYSGPLTDYVGTGPRVVRLVK